MYAEQAFAMQKSFVILLATRYCSPLRVDSKRQCCRAPHEFEDGFEVASVTRVLSRHLNSQPVSHSMLSRADRGRARLRTQRALHLMPGQPLRRATRVLLRPQLCDALLRNLPANAAAGAFGRAGGAPADLAQERIHFC